MCFVPETVSQSAVFLYNALPNGHMDILVWGFSGGQQEFIPDGLSYLLGGYTVVRAVALDSLQVQHLIK